MSSQNNNNKIEIREVWEHNIIQEMKLIDQILPKCKYISLDTEFGGQFIKHPHSRIFDYQLMKLNVELVKLIQVGLTFTDKHGQNPHVWQFNFNTFHPKTHRCYHKQSIDLLIRCGIDFDKNKTHGISEETFRELFVTTCGSALLSNGDVRWITFHGVYDVAYVMKILRRTKKLPDTEEEFLRYVNTYLPNLYDVKYMVRFTRDCGYGGLEKIAKKLEVERVGPAHQAGSDSLLTCRVFMKLKESDQWWWNCDNNNGGDDDDDDEKRVKKYCGVLFGMGIDSQR